MSETTLTKQELEALQRYDTPTICNALELAAPERRNTGFSVEEFRCLDPSLKPIVGYARTATIRAFEPTPAAAEEQRRRRVGYYEYVAAGPMPAVIVVQDLDPTPGFGAFWGEVNTTVHQALGALGGITNGSFRDIDDSAAGFQMLGGRVGPSHAWVHVVDWGGQVNVHGMTVKDGDLIHADRHGAVVIPEKVARELPAAADLLGRREKVILDACRAPGFSIDTLRKALADSAEIH